MNPEILKFLIANKDAIVALAAIGALIMSGITAVLSLFGSLRAKMIDVDIKRQDAIRKLVEADMVKMGEAMHETLARATILVKKFELKVHPNTTNLELSIKNYKQKIDESKKVLVDAKTTYRYKFHGLEHGLTIIARVADWVKGLRKDTDFANRLLWQAGVICNLIDEAIIHAYQNGRPPTRIVKLKIKYRVWRIQKMWSEYKKLERKAQTYKRV